MKKFEQFFYRQTAVSIADLITESLDYLLELSAQQTIRLKYHRVKALCLFKSGDASTPKDVATALGYHPVTVQTWIRRYRSGGIDRLIGIQSNRNDVPSWAIERLQQEVQTAQFLPSVGTIHTWLKLLGIKVCEPKASEVRSWISVFTNSDVASPSSKLLIEPDIYSRYQQWKQEHDIECDADALTRLISDFLELEPFQQLDKSPDDTNPDGNPSISEVPAFLKQTDLAKRLGVTDTMLKNNRNTGNFSRWTKLKDPDGIGWQWITTLRKYRSFL